jgi:hypothetical protein
MSGFDHKCPYCETEIDVHRAWESHDYSDDFLTMCEACHRVVQIDVATEPIFETSKPVCHRCRRAELTDSQSYCDHCLAEIKESQRVYKATKESQ